MTEVVAETQGEIVAPEPKARKRANGTLVKAEAPPAPAVVADQGDAFLAMIERAARDSSVDLDKLERLLDRRDRMEAQERERAFNDAFAKAQAEMEPIAANAGNPQTKSRYATYDALDRALRPIYTKHGFAMTFDTGATTATDVEVIADLIGHGHSRRYRIIMPVDGKGAKGGDVMTRTHAMGSGMSYGMRYLLGMAWNVAVVKKDDDGNAAGRTKPVERITEKQLADLNALLQRTDTPAANVQIIFEHFKIDNLSELTPDQYRKTVAQLTKKLGVA